MRTCEPILVLENKKTQNCIWVYRGVYSPNNYLLQIGENHNTEIINIQITGKELILKKIKTFYDTNDYIFIKGSFDII